MPFSSWSQSGWNRDKIGSNVYCSGLASSPSPTQIGPLFFTCLTCTIVFHWIKCRLYLSSIISRIYSSPNFSQEAINQTNKAPKSTHPIITTPTKFPLKSKPWTPFESNSNSPSIQCPCCDPLFTTLGFLNGYLQLQILYQNQPRDPHHQPPNAPSISLSNGVNTNQQDETRVVEVGKKSPFFPFYSPSPAHYLFSKKSPAPNSNSTPRRLLKKFPLSSSTKYIRTLLVRRHGSVKPNEAEIPTGRSIYKESYLLKVARSDAREIEGENTRMRREVRKRVVIHPVLPPIFDSMVWYENQREIDAEMVRASTAICVFVSILLILCCVVVVLEKRG